MSLIASLRSCSGGSFIRTINLSQNWSGYNHTKWSHVTFEHPATFDTLVMETKKKEEIKNDLTKFSNRQDHYKKIGKAWKRGYLLHGQPGTAMANFLDYDVYDLELTTVKDNTEIMKLLIETSGKSIIVIEDNCQRKQKKKEEEDEDELSPIEKQMKKDQAFKVLANKYLDAEEEGVDDELFKEIKRLLEVEKMKMTPADVGENLLMETEHEAKEICLKRLIEAKEEKEETKRKVVEEEKKKEVEKEIKRIRRNWKLSEEMEYL